MPLAFAQQVLVGTIPVPTTTETIALTTPLFELPRDSEAVVIIASLSFQPGTATTSITLRIRRGTGVVTDTQVGSGIVIIAGVTPGSAGVFVYQQVDIVAAPTAAIYTLTVQQAGATASGVVEANSSLVAMAML